MSLLLRFCVQILNDLVHLLFLYTKSHNIQYVLTVNNVNKPLTKQLITSKLLDDKKGA